MSIKRCDNLQYVLGIGPALGGSRYALQPVSLNGAPEG